MLRNLSELGVIALQVYLILHLRCEAEDVCIVLTEPTHPSEARQRYTFLVVVAELDTTRIRETRLQRSHLAETFQRQ